MKQFIALLLALFTFSFAPTANTGGPTSKIEGLRIRIHSSGSLYEATYLFAGAEKQMTHLKSSADLDAQAKSDFVYAVVNSAAGNVTTVELYGTVSGKEKLFASGTGSIVILGTSYHEGEPDTYFVQTHK